jgi:hypothetical protein
MEYNEGVLVVAVYVFVATAFSLPVVIAYLFIRIVRLLNRFHKFLSYAEDAEQETRKYHE